MPLKYAQVPLKWQWFGQGLGISTHVLLTLHKPVKHCELVLQLRPTGINRAGARHGVFASPEVPRKPVMQVPHVRAVSLQGLRWRCAHLVTLAPEQSTALRLLVTAPITWDTAVASPACMAAARLKAGATG